MARTTISIEIPLGAQVGDTLSFPLDGTTLELCMPEGTRPGDVLEVQLASSVEQEAELPPHTEQHKEVFDNNDKSQQQVEDQKCIPLWNNVSLDLFLEPPTRGDEHSDGTNAHVWPAAKYCIENVLAMPSSTSPHHKILQSPGRVLELGSGTGVLGLSFAILSSTNKPTTAIVLSDCSAGLPLLRRNIEHNRGKFPSKVNISCQILDWLERGRAVPDDDKFDLILGSDLLYNIELLDAVVETLDERLKENGHVLLSVRWRKPETERTFFQKTSNRGIDWSLLATPKDCALTWNEFGNPNSESSNTYFLQRSIAVNGALRPLAEIDEACMERMTDEEHDAFEQSFLQVYLGRKARTTKRRHSSS